MITKGSKPEGNSTFPQTPYEGGGLTMKRRKRSKMEAPEETGVASIRNFKILNFLKFFLTTS